MLAINQDQTIEQVKQEVIAFVGHRPMAVTNADECEAAKLATVEVRREQKRRKDEFKAKILDASERTYKEAKATFDKHKGVLASLLEPFIAWERETSSNILLWETKENERIRKEQEKENAKFAKRVESAIAKGKDVERVKPPRLVDAGEKTAKSDSGGYTTKEVKTLVVFDESVIPDKYWVKTLNRRLLDADLRAGQVVPGATLKVELQSAVRLS